MAEETAANLPPGFVAEWDQAMASTDEAVSLLYAAYSTVRRMEGSLVADLYIARKLGDWPPGKAVAVIIAFLHRFADMETVL